jgi:phosphoribosylaminoimidazolecarboxamide formyltransferase/IMP cyclohydrolase
LESDGQVKKGQGGLSFQGDIRCFFPILDGVDVGIKEGLTAIVNPGGSDRGFESIIACNEANPKVTMVLRITASKHKANNPL